MATRFLKAGHRPDYIIIATIVILVAFGLVMLVSASSELGKKNFDDTYYYLKHQLLYGFLPGLIGFFLCSKIHYRIYQKFAFLFLLASMIVVMLVFSPLGYRAGGAERWLKVGSIIFQPAEFLKLTFIVYLAAWFSNPQTKRHSALFEGFIPFLLICTLVLGTLVIQPATSIVVILLGAGLAIYFLGGGKIKFIIAVFFIALLGIGVLVYRTPYRLERVKTFLHLNQDTLEQGYHSKEALTAIGSGGIGGVGFGQSTAKAGRLPAPINDSIFAVIASELGFVGAGALIALFGFLVIRIFLLAKTMRDNFGRLILVGFGTTIALQSFVNIGAMTGVLPLTGVPLPFISYGGTAFAVFLTMSGMIVNISRYT